MNKAIFLDRDDTLIKNIPYLGDPQKVELLPHVDTALAKLQKAGFFLIMISNQSAVGRGLITEQQSKAVNREIMRQLGIQFDGVYLCFDHPHYPKEHCRKPSAKMILQAQKEHEIDLSRSFFIGDKAIDMQAGKKAGCRTILIAHPHKDDEERKAQHLADLISNDYMHIADWILTQAETLDY